MYKPKRRKLKRRLLMLLMERINLKEVNLLLIKIRKNLMMLIRRLEINRNGTNHLLNFN